MLALAVVLEDQEYREAFATAVEANKLVEMTVAATDLSETGFAAGEKRKADMPHSDAPTGKKVTQTGDGAAGAPIDHKTITQLSTNPNDHLGGAGATSLIVDKTSMQYEHQCTHSAHTDPDRSCSACFAGGAKNISHVRDKSRERSEGTWHIDSAGPSTPGVNVDSSGTNVQYGEYANARGVVGRALVAVRS